MTDAELLTAYDDALYALVEQALSTRTSAQWIEALAAADIPAGPVNDLQSLRDDPHLAGLRAVERAARAAEREACIKACEAVIERRKETHGYPHGYNAIMDCVDALREALGDER